MIKVVLFSTNTCTKCKSIKPLLEKVCKDNSIEFSEIKIDDEPDYIAYHNITSVPTIIVFNKDKGEIKRWVNYVSIKEFSKFIEGYKNNEN